MIPNIILIITKYSQHINPGKEITDTFYYNYRGLCSNNTDSSCYNWRTKINYSHNIFKISNGQYLQTIYFVPKCLRDYPAFTNYISYSKMSS